MIGQGSTDGRRGAKLSGVGAYWPMRTVHNTATAERLGLSEDWIRTRTGVIARRIADSGETVTAMAAKAATAALRSSRLPTGSLDLVILSCCTLRRPIPGAAAAVADALGLRGAPGFDINAGCAGFTHAVEVAAGLVRGGSARTVLVAASERLSDWTDADDKQTAALLGDGAGAVIVQGSDADAIGPVVWGSDGSRADLLRIPGDGDSLVMSGQIVYKWATSEMPGVARAACQAAGVSLEDLAALIPHQANRRIVEALARELKLPSDRVVWNAECLGNTSSASIPMALATAMEAGRLTNGDAVLLLAFGAGLAYSAQVVLIP